MDSVLNIRKKDQLVQIEGGAFYSMSDRNRGFITESKLIGGAILIAFAIALFTWPTVPKLTDYGEANPRNRDYTAGGSECQPASLATISDWKERIRRTDACAKEAEDYRQNTDDLIQQTRAADAAQAQADIASQQLWAGWFQTIGGFLTLCAAVAAAIYAREAANEGKRSADLADAELTETRKLTAAQLRPYVAITEVEDQEENPFSRNSKLRFRVKNFGQTPATNVRLSIGEATRSEPIQDFLVPFGDKWGDYGLLAPGDYRTETIYARLMALDDLAKIADGNVKLIVRFRIDYHWPGGSDFHDLTMILSDPATNKWHLLDERRRNRGEE